MPQGAAVDSDWASAGSQRVYLYQRLLFQFNPDLFLKANALTSPIKQVVKPMSNCDFNEFGSHVAPRYFWNIEDEFFVTSIGFSLVYQSKTVAVSFASFKIDKQLEIGVETNPEFRGRGFASLVCAELINYCLDNGYTPIWSCHAGNTGSKNLALRLGFEIDKTLPYYHLV